MADLEDVHRIVQSLPGTTAALNDKGSFRAEVAGHAFAWTWQERLNPKKPRVPNPAVLAVRVANAEEKARLLASSSERFFTEPHYAGFPAVLVRLARVTPKALTPLLEAAWRTKAPKTTPKDDAPTFFEDPVSFRRWLEEHHATAPELWVGFHKRGTKQPSITWPEAVDEALCFGWIDAVRKNLDATRYTIRFTRRKPGSIWSAVNLAKVKALIDSGRMRPAGISIYEARNPERTRQYSFEVKEVELSAPYLRALKANAAAWKGFQAQPPSYQRLVKHWVMRAKKEETRERRLASLIAACAEGQRLKQFSYKTKG